MSLQPGSAALFVEIKKMTEDKVLEAIKGTGGVVLKTSLDHTKEQALRDAIAEHAPAIAARIGGILRPEERVRGGLSGCRVLYRLPIN